MRIAAISTVLGFSSNQVEHRSTMPAANKRCPAERAARLDRAIRRTVLVLLTALLDVTCVLWVYPVADQLAEWAGVSLLHSVYVGMIAMLASIPLVISATVVAWRRKRTLMIAGRESV